MSHTSQEEHINTEFRHIHEYHWDSNYFDSRMPWEVEVMGYKMLEWQRKLSDDGKTDLDSIFGYDGNNDPAMLFDPARELK